ncbi:hypothetical protein LGH70_05120 [Hymenobacter sp. BT635]|uniref:Uncharacterized protein n=1 Tax=Hymenobacter nitidus TaxID=2880929 RepID=A0ABS8A972_9BACT|nr:hypothetical protein [Hymenobacter nitidus]MCB2376950.1 hypothetical protein [Hymenobacter nitidus]
MKKVTPHLGVAAKVRFFPVYGTSFFVFRFLLATKTQNAARKARRQPS